MFEAFKLSYKTDSQIPRLLGSQAPRHIGSWLIFSKGTYQQHSEEEDSPNEGSGKTQNQLRVRQKDQAWTRSCDIVNGNTL